MEQFAILGTSLFALAVAITFGWIAVNPKESHRGDQRLMAGILAFTLLIVGGIGVIKGVEYVDPETRAASDRKRAEAERELLMKHLDQRNREFRENIWKARPVQGSDRPGGD